MTAASVSARYSLIPFVTSLLLLLLLLLSAHAATPRTLIAKVDRVSDGDTLIATTSEGTRLRIPLLGIDALGSFMRRSRTGSGTQLATEGGNVVRVGRNGVLSMPTSRQEMARVPETISN